MTSSVAWILGALALSVAVSGCTNTQTTTNSTAAPGGEPVVTAFVDDDEDGTGESLRDLFAPDRN